MSDANLPRLRKWSVAAGVLHLVLCLALLASGAATVWTKRAPSSVVPTDYLHAAWGLLVGFTGLTAFFHLYVYPKVVYTEDSKESLNQGRNAWRFLEYSFTASAMLLVIAILSGVQDTVWLTSLAVASALVMFLGYVVEKNTPEKLGRAWGFTALAWVLLLGAYGSVLYRFAELAGGDRKPPEFVYAVVVCMLLLFCSFGLVQVVWLLRKGQGSVRYEYAYLVLSLVAKTLLVGLTASGVPPLLSQRSNPP